MRISDFFKNKLGANLKNQRWSWGAYDPVNNRVFLRVWEDQIRQIRGEERVMVDWKHLRRKSGGSAERQRHLELIKNGVQGYGVICVAKDTKPEGARVIASFHESPLVLLGEFTEDANGVYAKIGARVGLNHLTRRQTGHSSLVIDLGRIQGNRRIDATEREALANARVGQGLFRSLVLEMWNGRCAVTGSTVLDAIRASHMKPWRDSNNYERLDPNNGLPLIASLDALFDAGLISFNQEGVLLISSQLSNNEIDIFGLEGAGLFQRPNSSVQAYLGYHQKSIFQA